MKQVNTNKNQMCQSKGKEAVNRNKSNPNCKLLGDAFTGLLKKTRISYFIIIREYKHTLIQIFFKCAYK